MDIITRYLTNDHIRCHQTFVEAKSCVSADLWNNAATCFQQFRDVLEQHFSMEEKVMLLEFERATGCSKGANSVMHNEHLQINAVVSKLQDALTRRDKNTFLCHAETLGGMMRQHNLKEDGILYLMADRMLSRERIIASVKEIDALS